MITSLWKQETMMKKHYPHSRLYRRMKGQDCSESLIKQLSYYTDTLNKVAPYEISISWVEVLLYTPYPKDNELILTRTKLVLSWFKDYNSSHKTDDNLATQWDINYLTTLLGQILVTGMGLRY